MTPITIRTDQFGMVIAGLRLLKNAIGTATLDEDLEAIITSGGTTFPTSEEVDALCEMLGLPDNGDSP
jgi:hypothetical protein